MIEELDTAFRRCIAEGYTTFVSFYGNKVHVTLTKRGTNSLQMEVRGEGDTVAGAFTTAFANFPQNPLDGASRWHDPRLSGPVSEGVFTEASDETPPN